MSLRSLEAALERLTSSLR